MKSSAFSDSEIQAHLPWSRNQMITRVGGVYAVGDAKLMTVGGRPLLAIRRDERGLLTITACITNLRGEEVLAIEDNMFWSDPTSLEDLEVAASATRLTARTAQRRIGFDMSFGRVTAKELTAVLKQDSQAVPELSELPPWDLSLLSRLPPWDGNPADRTARLVLAHATRLMDSEGTVAFANIEELHYANDSAVIDATRSLRMGAVAMSYCFLDVKGMTLVAG